MLRQRSPQTYRAFLRKWRDLHQRGVADRLAAQSDAALRLRIERMILDMPALADLHESARAYVQGHGVQVSSPPPAPPPPTPGPARRTLPTRGRPLRRRRRQG